MSTTTGARVKEKTRTNPKHPGDFTVVKAGEALDDVALRVYGTTGEAALLWRANRDALERPDSPLKVGMLLRTPRNRRMKGEG